MTITKSSLAVALAHVLIGTAGSGQSVRLTAELGDQKYCAGDAAVFSVIMELRVRVENVSDSRVILSRALANPLQGRVASTEEEARAGEFLYTFSGSKFFGESVDPEFDERPDPERFVTLQPGEAYETRVESGVLVHRRGASEPLSGTIAAGTRGVLQVDVPLWPYQTMPEEEIRRLRLRWQKQGELATTLVKSNWIAFEVPESVTVDECTE